MTTEEEEAVLAQAEVIKQRRELDGVRRMALDMIAPYSGNKIMLKAMNSQGSILSGLHVEVDREIAVAIIEAFYSKKAAELGLT